MSYDKIVLDPDDQFDISCRDHLDNMVMIMREMMESHMIPIKFDEYQFEQFVKRYSTVYDKMHIKYDSYMEELEAEKSE